MMGAVKYRKKIFQPLLASQGINECCDSLYFLPGDYQGSLSIRAAEDDKGKDKGKGVMPGMGCHDSTTGLKPAADLQVAPQLATPIMTNGISVALLAIATGVAIASDGKRGMRVAQNIQPVGINRDLLKEKVTKAFTIGNVADTYRGKTGDTHEVHNLTFLACVCEWDRVHPSHPVAPTFGPNNLLGEPKARLLKWDDVQRLSKVLLEKEIENAGSPEKGLVAVLQLVNEQYNSFQKVTDFEKVLSRLCDELEVPMKELHCSGIGDTCFLVKIAWASLNLPILGAVSGQTRMIAASHVLQEIEPSNDGTNCVRKKGSLQIPNGETPSSLHSTTAQVEFLIVSHPSCCLTEDTVKVIYAEALRRQGQAMRGDPLSFQVIVLGLMKDATHDVGKASSDSFIRKTFLSNLQLLGGRVANSLLAFSQIEGVPIKSLTAAHMERSPNTTLSEGVRKVFGKSVSRHKEPAWSELFQKVAATKTAATKQRSSIRSVKVEFFASLVGIEIADTIAKSPHQAFLDFFQHNGRSDEYSAWKQEGKPMGVWMHPAKPSETGEYVGEWVQEMKGEATGIWWVSPSTVGLRDCELSWTLTLEAGLLRPLASLLTAGLLEHVASPHSMVRSMGFYESSIVREWVYAFLWEVLVWTEGFAVPIPAAWKDLQNLRELLAVVYKDELGLVSWVSVALKGCQPKKEFCTNLFGIVAFMLGLLVWEDSGYSLSSSFTEITSIHGIRKDGNQDKGLLAPACFRVSCPLVVREGSGKALSLFQWLQELLGNSDASNELADKFDKEYLCSWKIGEKSNSWVAGLFGNHETGPDIKKTFFLNLSSSPDERKEADGNSASEANEGVGEDVVPPVVTVEQGLREKNVLLLGMTQPAAKEVDDLDNPGDRRDLARCMATEKVCQVNVFTVSKAAKVGIPQNSDRHLQADFSTKHFIQQMTNKFGADIRFDQVVLDYFWMPDTYMSIALTKLFYEIILPNLASFLTSKGLIFLPCLPSICIKLIEFNAKLKEHYAITFRGEAELDDHVLWKATTHSIDDITMRTQYQKEPNQLKVSCDNLAKQLLAMSCAEVRRDDVKGVCACIQLVDNPRMVCLRLLGPEDNTHDVGGMLGFNTQTMNSKKRKGKKPNEQISKKSKPNEESKKPKKQPKLGDDTENYEESLIAELSIIDGVKNDEKASRTKEEGATVGGIKGLTTKRKRSDNSDEESSDNSDEESNDEDEAPRARKQKNLALDRQKKSDLDKQHRKVREAVPKKAEKEKERRKEAGQKKDEKERRKEAEKQRKKDEKDKESDVDKRKSPEEVPTIIHPDPSLKLSKGEMLVAPCDRTEFERVSSKVEFRHLNLGKGLNIYVCDFIPVEHLKNMTNFHGSSHFQETLEVTRNNILPYDVRTSDKELKNYEHTNNCSYGNYYPYLDKGLNEKGFNYHASLKEHPPSEVEKFLRDVSKGLNEVTGNELLNGDLEIHGLCIDTVTPVHQRGHIDHASSYDVDKLSFVGHMPLDQEGMVLRLENISSEMRECLLQKERNLDEKVEIVERILYIHVPFGSILVIDDRTFHGGHYGSKQVRRFHFVVSPRKWRNDEQGDRLLFLLEAARQHTKKWREHTGNWKDGGWAEKDDPKVAQPKLPIGELNKMIGQIKYSTRTKYYESFVEHCYPENTLDNLKMVSKLIPDYIHTKCFNDSTK